AEIAEEDLKKYKTGDYLQKLKDDLGQIETASSDLSQQEDREAWAYRMAKKGYRTPSQAQAETALTERRKLVLAKTKLQLDILTKYTKTRQLTIRITNLEDALRTLQRTKNKSREK